MRIAWRTGMALLALGAVELEAQAKPPPRYRVREETSLGEIAVRLYGDYWKWRAIARANRLAPPYVLEPGQVLVLPEPPKLSPKRGKRKLLQMWRRRLDEREKEQERADAIGEPPGAPAARPAAGVDAAGGGIAATPVETEKSLKPVAPSLGRAQAEEASRLERARAARRAEIAEAELRARQAAVLAKAKAEAEAKGELEAPSSAENLLSDAQSAYKKGDCETAAAKARRSRQMDSEPMVPWILEIRCLRTLGKDDEAKKTAESLFERHPVARELPMFRKN